MGRLSLETETEMVGTEKNPLYSGFGLFGLVRSPKRSESVFSV